LPTELEGGGGPALTGVTWEQCFGGGKLLTPWGEIKGPMAQYDKLLTQFEFPK